MNNYKGVYISCPVCCNPNIKKQNIARHIRTDKCFRDELLKTYFSLDEETLDKVKQMYRKTPETVN